MTADYELAKMEKKPQVSEMAIIVNGFINCFKYSLMLLKLAYKLLLLKWINDLLLSILMDWLNCSSV